MPKNKKPNRKPGVKKVKRMADDANQGVPDGSQGIKQAAKSYGAPKSADSHVSPAMTQRSARSR